MGYHLNRLDKSVFMAVSKPLLTEFGIHHRLESCAEIQSLEMNQILTVLIGPLLSFFDNIKSTINKLWDLKNIV